jgi:hypothetical protein
VRFWGTKRDIHFRGTNICSYNVVMLHAHAVVSPPPGTKLSSAIPAQAGMGSWPVLGQLANERILPVLPQLAGLFPLGGLPRGGTILLGPMTETSSGSSLGTSGLPGRVSAGQASGLTSFLLLLLAGASSQGHWCALAGLAEVGFVAAKELGVDLDHLVFVPSPGPAGRWQSVVATLLETVDLVCLAPGSLVRAADARRLSARAREHGATLVVLDAPEVPLRATRGFRSGGSARQGRAETLWPGPLDLRCTVRTSSWSGLERGHGLLGSRVLEAEVGGRGIASRARRGQLRLPA